MAHLTFLSRPWLSACVLLAIHLTTETSGWLVQPSCSTARTARLSRCRRPTYDVQSGLRSVRRRTRLVPPPRSRRLNRHAVALNANQSKGGESGGDNDATLGGAEKQQRVQTAEDTDAPILYIKGLREGGGVGVWGKDGKKNNGNDNGDDGSDVSWPKGGGNTVMMARALRNAEREFEGGGNYEEELEEEKSVDEPADTRPAWEKVEASLGLGVWSYVGLGLAVFIIALNNVLGVGWAAKIIDPEYEPDSVLSVQQQGRQIQYMPLDDESNLLSD